MNLKKCGGGLYKEENRRMMNLLNELQPLGETQRPLAELYIQEKEMLAPGVNKVLAVDIEAWKNLSDAELAKTFAILVKAQINGGLDLSDITQSEQGHV